MKKKRHSWGDLETNKFTEQQQCKKCGVFRFKALGIWMYSKEKCTEENMFNIVVRNKGCAV